MLLALHRGIKTDGRTVCSGFNNLIQTVKSTTADKQDVGSIQRDRLLLGVLSSALGRNIGNGAFQDLEEGLLNAPSRRWTAIVMVSLAFVLRYCCLTYETLDYQDWLRVWLSALRENGAWHGLGQPIWSCNYNPPYLYFLALITLSDIYELLLIKLVSILFYVLLAFFTMRLAGLFTDSPARRLTAFIGVLWLPTVYLNGAYWGQCDVIYASFAVLAVYLALSYRPGWSAAMAAYSMEPSAR